MSLNEQLINDMNLIALDIQYYYQKVMIDWKYAKDELPDPKKHSQIMVWQKDIYDKGQYSKINIFKPNRHGIWKFGEKTLDFNQDWYWAKFNPESLIALFFRHPKEKEKPTQERYSNEILEGFEEYEKKMATKSTS